MPAEWESHQSVWLAFPCDGSLWEDHLLAAQAEFIAFCHAIADVDPMTNIARGEKLNILLHPNFPDAAKIAQCQLEHLPVTFHAIAYGDIWLRDTAPLFLKNAFGQTLALSFTFNGWGHKYDLPHDTEVAAKITKIATVQTHRAISWIAEGGALEFDGEGTCLTSRQCLLAKNRNPHLNQTEIEQIIIENLGVEKILWVTDGLLNDHTDGHIDTIARFVAPGVIAVMSTQDDQDPNFHVIQSLIHEIASLVDARGRKIKIMPIPSPGKVINNEGDIMPASYLNFYIGNTTVVVPTYGQPQDQEAVDAIATCFPNKRTIGLSAIAILSGGGAFHCITQQQPS